MVLDVADRIVEPLYRRRGGMGEVGEVGARLAVRVKS
jgi:hypothetical protein